MREGNGAFDSGDPVPARFAFAACAVRTQRLLNGADGAVGFVILEGAGKTVRVGDLDGIA